MPEGVTVTGEAPLLDTTSALKQTVITREELEALPNRVDIWSVTRVMPSVIMNKVDVGGSQMFLQSQATTRGTTTESGYFIDGLDVSGQDGNGGNAVLYIDPYAFQESTFQFGGAGPGEHEQRRPALQRHQPQRHQPAPRRRHVQRHRTAHERANITPALRTELLAGLTRRRAGAGAGPIRGQRNPEAVRLRRVGRRAGHPDRLWFSGSTHIQGMDQYPLGSFDAQGNPVIDDYLMSTTTAKISWQMTKSAQLSYFDNLHYKGVYHRNGVGNNNTNFSDNLARTLNTKWPNVQQVKFTTPYRSSFVIDLAYARLRDDDRFDPRPEVSNGAISRFDSLTNTFTEAWPTYNFNLHKRDQAHASINYFTGKHDIRAGYSIFVNGKPSAIWSTSAMRADYRNGQPDLGPHLQRRHLRSGDGTRRRAAVHAGQPRAGLLHPGQVDADAQAGDQLRRALRVQLRMAGCDLPAGDGVLHHRPLLRRDQGSAGYEERPPALRRRLRLEGRRQDGAEVRRQPLRPADSDGVRRPPEPCGIDERSAPVAAAEPVQRLPACSDVIATAI